MQNQIGSALRKRRAEMGLTQREVAALLSVSIDAYRRWEWGKVKPQERFLKRIQDVLGVSMAESFPQVVYLAVTQDKFELPIAVADSPGELAELMGVTKKNVCSVISNSKRHKRSMYVKVVI